MLTALQWCKTRSSRWRTWSYSKQEARQFSDSWSAYHHAEAYMHNALYLSRTQTGSSCTHIHEECTGNYILQVHKSGSPSKTVHWPRIRCKRASSTQDSAWTSGALALDTSWMQSTNICKSRHQSSGWWLQKQSGWQISPLFRQSFDSKSTGNYSSALCHVGHSVQKRTLPNQKISVYLRCTHACECTHTVRTSSAHFGGRLGMKHVDIYWCPRRQSSVSVSCNLRNRKRPLMSQMSFRCMQPAGLDLMWSGGDLLPDIETPPNSGPDCKSSLLQADSPWRLVF